VLAIFGLPGTRREAYRQLSSLKSMMSGLGVEEILDIGPEFDAPSVAGGIPVRRMGVMAAAELGDLLSGSMFGFVQHSSFSLAKSGVLAGLCAFGAIPLIATPFAGEFDGLRDGVHVISPGTVEAARKGGLQHCSRAAWLWHAQHNLRAHASSYSNWLMNAD
jgi:hypothetical protein